MFLINLRVPQQSMRIPVVPVLTDTSVIVTDTYVIVLCYFLKQISVIELKMTHICTHFLVLQEKIHIIVMKH